MSLAHATLPDGSTLGLESPGPWPTSLLAPLVERAFSLLADDPFVRSHGDAAHAYLDSAKLAWTEHLDHMDFLDPASPIHHLKLLERELYLREWEAPLASAHSVLDVGCGVGRFTHWLLARGKSVIGVDADLRSLQRLVWRAVGLPGALDVHWSSVHTLPHVTVDAVIACEVLCYVPDIDAAMEALVARLRPGGCLCLSVEARWGWPLSVDVSPGGIAHALLGTPDLDLPGDRWVHTYEADELEALLTRHGLTPEVIVPNHYVLDGPLEQVTGEITDTDVLFDLEDAARHHPIYGPLNRIWSVVARRGA